MKLPMKHLTLAPLPLLACAVALAACSATGYEPIANADPSCPDPHSIYVNYYEKPDCWSDREWEQYLRAVSEDAQGGAPR